MKGGAKRLGKWGLKKWIKGGWKSKAAKDVLSGTLKREFPGQYLNMSLSEIKKALKGAIGPEKKALQKAKKLLEQQERLGGKLK